jgi:hypothetical protein
MKMSNRDREFYLRSIEEIVEKDQEDFGIEEYKLGRVTWIGRPGYSDSVEAWINKVYKLIKSLDIFSANEHWFVRCWSKDAKDVDQHHIYFGFHYGKLGKDNIIACGGATDYSGQGRHAKELAESFMRYISECSHGVVRILDHEIGYLIEHMLSEGEQQAKGD